MAKKAKKFWLDDSHIKKLAKVSKKTKASESEIIRNLIDEA